MNSIYKSIFTTFLVFLPSFLFAQESNLEKNAAQFPNGIAAIVEDNIITYDDLHRQMGPYIQMVQQQASSKEEFVTKIDEIARKVIDSMIDEKLMVKEFKDKKGVIPDSFLENYYSNFIKENFEGKRSKYLEYLKAIGMNDRSFKEQQREQIIINFIRREVTKSQAEISPERIQDYYNTHIKDFSFEEGIHLRQITLSPIANESSELLKQEAEKIILEFKKGTKFEKLAKKYSQDDMKSTGGDWGWINRSDIRKDLADIAFNLKKQTPSKPISIDNHIVILFAEDVRKAGAAPIDEVREQIATALNNEINIEAYNKKIKKLRKKAYIRYYL